MSIQPASGPNGVTPNMLPSVTPESMLIYCQSRLNQLDTQIQSLFNEQEAANRQTAAVNDALQDLVGSGAEIDVCDSKRKETIEKAFSDAIQRLGGPGTPGGKVLDDILKRVQYSFNGDGHGNGIGNISAQTLQEYSNQIKGVLTDLNASAELRMIQINSLMSQRQTAVQLSTNVVQVLGDTTRTIAQNTGK
jgi:hypothetical protein